MGEHKAFLLEIATFSIAGALIAEKSGAERIEYCENPEEGGTTPSFGSLRVIKEKINIPIFPIIRPRGGDFLYTEEEFDVMRRDVSLCKSVGFEGIVIGILQADGSIDMRRTTLLVEEAYPMEVTFHRAFDRCINPLESLETVINCGCQRILTSGQFPSAMDGAGLIKQLIEKADNRIIIMPGSGLNSGNISELANQTGATEFHSSARIPIKSQMLYEVPSMNESLTFMGVNETEVKSMRLALNALSIGQ